MKKVFLLSKVDEDKCVGDRFCVNVCPTRAIRMENKKAVVDEAKCAGCLHCLDACSEGAIMVLGREEPLVLGVDTSEMDPAEIADLCNRADFEPEDRICLCMDIRAEEVAGAILQGAHTPEEVSFLTGIRTSCGMWCMAPVQRLLQAHGASMEPKKGSRWYPVDTGVWDIPEEVARKYPEYRLEEDSAQFNEGSLENLVSIFKVK
jgi:NAD-dependent dihydropyrimidine dehydrogenase PreA subunit/bacterioferritin-associated ferredoxin